MHVRLPSLLVLPVNHVGSDSVRRSFHLLEGCRSQSFQYTLLEIAEGSWRFRTTFRCSDSNRSIQRNELLEGSAALLWFVCIRMSGSGPAQQGEWGGVSWSRSNVQFGFRLCLPAVVCWFCGLGLIQNTGPSVTCECRLPSIASGRKKTTYR